MPLLVSRPAIFPAVRYRNSTGSGTSPCRRPLQLLAALSASRISHTCMCRARYLGRQLLRWDCLKRPQNCSLKCGMARMRTSSRHRKCARQKIRRPLGSNHSSVRSSLLRICRLPENTFQRKCTQVPINAESEKNREKAHVRFCDLPRLTARVRGSAPSLNSYFAIQVTQSDAVRSVQTAALLAHSSEQGLRVAQSEPRFSSHGEHGFPRVFPLQQRVRERHKWQSSLSKQTSGVSDETSVLLLCEGFRTTCALPNNLFQSLQGAIIH